MRKQSLRSPSKKNSIVQLAKISDERLDEIEKSPLKKLSLKTNGELDFSALESQKNKPRLEKSMPFSSEGNDYDPYEKPKISIDNLDHKLRKLVEDTHREIKPIQNHLQEL